MVVFLLHVCMTGGLIPTVVQVLLGRSDVSGWGAFLKVLIYSCVNVLISFPLSSNSFIHPPE